MYFARSGSPGSRHASAYSPGSALTWIGIRETLYAKIKGMAHIVEPPLEQILEYCAEDPVERVFLEDVARRGLGRFAGVAEDGRLVALCHTGANVVPSGRGCGVFADVDGARPGADADRRAGRGVRALGRGRGPAAAARGRTGPASPSTRSRRRPSRGERACAPATLDDLDLLVPACAQAHEVELGIDPLAPRRGRVPLAHAGADRGGALVALGGGRRHPLQGRGVGVDARGGAAAAGLDRPGRARRGQRRAAGLRDLIRLLLERVPRVCLFVRADNDAGDRALREDRDGARARLPQRSAVRELVLARHAESEFNVLERLERRPVGARSR